jgi:hypothetical protein
MAKDYGPHGGSSRSSSKSTGSHSRSYNPGAGGVVDHSPRSRTDRSRIQTDRQADFQANPKKYVTPTPRGDGILSQTRSALMGPLTKGRAERELRRRMSNRHGLKKWIGGNDLWARQTANPHLDYDEDDLTRIAQIQEAFNYGKGPFDISQESYYDIFPTDRPIQDTGGGGEGQPYIWPPVEPVGIAALEDEVIDDDFALNLAAGRFRVPEQYRVAEGGRIPAAFGGIMDSGTGRKAYGFGSVFKSIARIPKKAVKAVKKIAKSPIGKLALSYLATAGMANIMQPGAAQWGSPLGKGSGWLRPGQVWKNLSALGPGATTTEGVDIGFQEALRKQKEKSLLTKGIKALKNPWVSIPGAAATAGLLTAKQPVEELESIEGSRNDPEFEAFMRALRAKNPNPFQVRDEYIYSSAEGGRVPAQEGGLMNLGGMEKDYRNDGGFVPIGGEEKADDVPARLSRNEFVFTADAVRNAGGGDIDKGAEVMENVMKNLEAGGKVSEDSQGKGAQEMFEVSERLSEVV